jgi:hypothetical protein
VAYKIDELALPKFTFQKMNKKIAILRGINVGGKRKILMNDLKELFQNLEYSKQ